MGALRFTFSCRRCGSILEATSELSGQLGRCPTCGGVFSVPQVDTRTGLAAGPAEVADDGQLPTPMHAYANAGVRAPTIRRLDNGDQVVVCPRCSREMPIEAHTCVSCGLPFTLEGAEAAVQANEGTSGLATASLALGVMSIMTACLPILALPAIGLGVAALRRTKSIGQRQPGRGVAIAGIICGLVALAIAIAAHAFKLL